MTHTIEKKGFTGWHMILVLGLAFSVVFTVNAIFVTAAIKSWTGEVDPNAYERGINYNDILDSRAAQADLGWSAAMDLDQSGSAPILTIMLHDADGQPLQGAAMTAEIRRPTHEGYDHTVLLTEAAPGRYTASLDLPLAGQWAVRAIAARGDDRFEAESRIIRN